LCMDQLHLFCYLSTASHQTLTSFPTRRSSDLSRAGRGPQPADANVSGRAGSPAGGNKGPVEVEERELDGNPRRPQCLRRLRVRGDRKSTRLNSSHQIISYAVFCLKKKKI